MDKGKLFRYTDENGELETAIEYDSKQRLYLDTADLMKIFREPNLMAELCELLNLTSLRVIVSPVHILEMKNGAPKYYDKNLEKLNKLIPNLEFFPTPEVVRECEAKCILDKVKAPMFLGGELLDSSDQLLQKIEQLDDFIKSHQEMGFNRSLLEFAFRKENNIFEAEYTNTSAEEYFSQQQKIQRDLENAGERLEEIMSSFYERSIKGLPDALNVIRENMTDETVKIFQSFLDNTGALVNTLSWHKLAGELFPKCFGNRKFFELFMLAPENILVESLQRKCTPKTLLKEYDFSGTSIDCVLEFIRNSTRDSKASVKSSTYYDMLHLSYLPYVGYMSVDKQTYSIFSQFGKKIEYKKYFARLIKNFSNEYEKNFAYLKFNHKN